MNILITGPVNVGKSTLLNKILIALNQPYTGFYTQTIYQDKCILGYQMCDYSNNIEPFTIGIKNTPNSCLPIIEAFETQGVCLLENSLTHSKTIVMDELGFLESNAPAYQDIVKACLDADNLVIGIIKKKSSSFLNEIRNRIDIVLYEVTLENREQLFQEIYTSIISK